MIRFPLALALLLLTACAGSWAQDTHVSIASIAPSQLRGEADIVQATNCGARCSPTGGSDIRVTINAMKAGTNYDIVLAKGSCSEFRSFESIQVLGRRGALLPDDIRTTVAIPVHPLTAGGYVLFFRKDGNAQPLACGQIRGNSLY